MLELNKYDIKKIEDLKDFITVTFVIIDDIYHEIAPTNVADRRNLDKATLSDSEIITISIVGELMTIDSENAWFNFVKRNFKDLFPCIGDRTRFNRTRRNLYLITKEIRKKLCFISGFSDSNYRIVDSMPIPVCKFGRALFHKTFKQEAEYGRCPSKKETYYGFKLHVISTFEGFITDFIVTPANVDDREAVWDLVDSYNSITVLGDKGYINRNLNPMLKNEKNISLLFIKRNNSKNPYPKWLRQMIFKIRRRIETSFSQLAEQLNVNRVRAKSLWGFFTRIQTKILGHNLCYLINKILGKDIDIGHIKELIFG